LPVALVIIVVFLILATGNAGLSGTAVGDTSTPNPTRIFSTSLPVTPAPTFDSVEIAVAATVSAVRAVEERTLSAAEIALVAPLMRDNYTSVLLLSGTVALAALLLSGATLIMVWRGNSWQPTPKRAHAPHHGQASAGQPELPLPLLADFQIFVSSSEKDRQWVERLVADLARMDYLVWWYAKDAPGLPFGNEIRSAIYHTKIFMIVLSPDSMASKHVEEEIRWAEIYDRPIIPVLHRPISVDQRLYGLAKGADIDFADTRYRDALELLAQAIDHYLEKRLETLNVTPA
jgi:hypothetical protein